MRNEKWMEIQPYNVFTYILLKHVQNLFQQLTIIWLKEKDGKLKLTIIVYLWTI